MADEVTVKREQIPPVPDGQFQAVCVDVVNLGERVERFQNQPPIIVPKAAIVFQLGEANPDTGKRWEIAREFTVSFGKRANLRKMLEDWRGKSYTDDEAAAGVPLHKLEGHNAILSVEHKTSGSGNIYAQIKTAVPILKQMPAIKAQGYERADFWAKKKDEYRAEVEAYKAASAPPQSDEEALARITAPDDSDDLPFR